MNRTVSVPESVLIVDDEPLVANTLAAQLRGRDFKVASVASLTAMWQRLEEDQADLILLDVNLPDGLGIDAIPRIAEIYPGTAVIVMTGHSSIDTAVQAIRNGASDYVTKPLNWDELDVVVRKSVKNKRLQQQSEDAAQRNSERFSFHRIVAKSQVMAEAVNRARTAAESPAATILLLGESGTGKGLFANSIHCASSRQANAFQKVMCSAIPEPLLEAELFGHEQGAFTDAKRQRRGEFEVAHTGTLFLDEIGDMPLSLQAKLLGVIEDRSFSRVGGTKNIEVDVRIVAATHRDLAEWVDSGRFREDLRFRLEVVPIVLPALRERTEDVIPLANLFIDHFNREFGRDVRELAPSATSDLCDYSWPGNVRELRNVIERAMLFSTGNRLSSEHLSIHTGYHPRTAGRHAPEKYVLPKGGISLDEVEQNFVRQAMTMANGNQSKAAGLLGISRDQMRYRLEKMGLLPPRKGKSARRSIDDDEDSISIAL